MVESRNSQGMLLLEDTQCHLCSLLGRQTSPSTRPRRAQEVPHLSMTWQVETRTCAVNSVEDHPHPLRHRQAGGACIALRRGIGERGNGWQPGPGLPMRVCKEGSANCRAQQDILRISLGTAHGVCPPQASRAQGFILHCCPLEILHNFFAEPASSLWNGPHRLRSWP